MSREAVAAGLLDECCWIFAKTMPKNPHYYTLRRTWKDEDFVDTVFLIREIGIKQVFRGKEYIIWNSNGYFYWTMGAPVNLNGKPHTILINRKKAEYKSGYDIIAKTYESLFHNLLYEAESVDAVRLTEYSGRVLDVGCGTGLFLEHAIPEDYVGIDISSGMLKKLKDLHPAYAEDVINVSMADYYGCGFDTVIALFGSASYLSPDDIKKAISSLNDGGRYFFMFYKDDYHPITYEKTGVSVGNCHSMFAEIPNDKSVIDGFGNYTIVSGVKNG